TSVAVAAGFCNRSLIKPFPKFAKIPPWHGQIFGRPMRHDGQFVKTLDISWRKRLTSLLLPSFSPLLDRANWSARWIETVRNTKDCKRFPNREEMFAHLHAEHFENGSRPLDYLEFGVFEGKSLRHWCSLNSHPQSRFFGFDSFQGLPESWNGAPTGTYSASG